MSDKRSRDIVKNLIEAVQNNYSVYAWSSIDGVVSKYELKTKAVRKSLEEVDFEIVPSEDVSIEKVIPADKVVKFYVPDSSLSFEARLKNILGTQRFQTYLPFEFKFYERRKHERVSPKESCTIIFEHKRQVFKKTILDLSLGGVAILIPKTEKAILGEKLDSVHCLIELGTKRIKAKIDFCSSAIIDRFQMEQCPYGGYKISFRFSSMEEKDKEILNKFIATEVIVQKISKKI